MRLPTFAQLRRFVAVEGWQDKDALSRKKAGDHHRYVFTTPTGERLYTRISHGRGQIRDPGLFEHILRDQLKVEAEQFWAAVDRGEAPRRPTPASAVAGPGAMDAKLARALITKAGLSPGDLVGLSQDDAVRLWQEWLASGGGAPPGP